MELFAARGKYHFCFIALFVKKILKEKPQTVQFMTKETPNDLRYLGIGLRLFWFFLYEV